MNYITNYPQFNNREAYTKTYNLNISIFVHKTGITLNSKYMYLTGTQKNR